MIRHFSTVFSAHLIDIRSVFYVAQRLAYFCLQTHAEFFALAKALVCAGQIPFSVHKYCFILFALDNE